MSATPLDGLLPACLDPPRHGDAFSSIVHNPERWNGPQAGQLKHRPCVQGNDLPRYFFDVHDGVDVRDTVGRELPDLNSARRAAAQLAVDYAKEIDNLLTSGVLVVTVRDEADAIATVVRLICQIDSR